MLLTPSKERLPNNHFHLSRENELRTQRNQELLTLLPNRGVVLGPKKGLEGTGDVGFGQAPGCSTLSHELFEIAERLGLTFACEFVARSLGVLEPVVAFDAR